MTTSDIERALAEARAAAARRLEALRRVEGESVPAAQDEPAHAGSVETVIIPRRAPEAYAAPDVTAPNVHGARLDEPGAIAPAAAPFYAQSASPLAAQGVPIPAPQDSLQATDLQYAAYEPVEAPGELGRGDGYVSVDPLPPRPAMQHASGGHADVYSDELAQKPGLMAGVTAGFAAFLRSRAERRAMARENALQSADAAAPHPRKQRLTAKEQRWERRRKRYLFEEILGWILVPIILVAVYFFAVWLLGLFGTTPEALIEGLQLIWSQLR